MVKEIIENIEREAGIEGREKKIIELIKRLITLRCNYDGLEFALKYIKDLYLKLGESCEAERIENTIRQVCLDEKIDYTECIDEIGIITEENLQDYAKEWSDKYYKINEDVIYLLIQAVKGNSDWRDDIEFINNIGWIWENLTQREEDAYIVIASDGIREQEKNLTVQLLKMLKKRIFVLLPEDGQEEGMYQIKEMEGISYVSYQDGKIYEVVEYLCSQIIPDKLATVLATGGLLTSLSYMEQNQMKLERLSPYCAEQFERTITFGWAGDYCSYLSTIMKEDVKEEMDREPEYKFSILIPVRNNVDTLRYTVMTCLEQEYEGDYEIVISDNSSYGNDELKEFCEKLQEENKRIKYYRTPRELRANKSYEFGVLQTRGEFVLIIGADDAVLPWGLRALDEVLQYTEADVIKWDRGQYIWPGYGKGLDDLLTMPGGYQKEIYNLYEIPNIDYWSQVMTNYQCMYNLPNLYLNSGFRRRYLNKLYEKTGRIWDGRINDISLGVINICINDTITHLSYPITIAGNSRYSIGRAADQVQAGFDDFRGSLKGRGSVGYVAGIIEDKYDPDVQKESGSFYSILLYEIRKRIVPPAYAEKLFDWKKIALDIYAGMQPDDMYYERDINQLYSFFKLINEDIAIWFKNEIYDKAFHREPENNKIDNKIEKVYSEGADANGAYCLDASKYGATNIYEAVKLCKIASEL